MNVKLDEQFDKPELIVALAGIKGRKGSPYQIKKALWQVGFASGSR